MMKFLNKNRKLISILILLIACGFIFVPGLLLCKANVDSLSFKKLEAFYFTSQIISAIFIIGGSIVAVWQYYLSTTNRKKELEFARVEKAIELSNYYKDNILDRYFFVKTVFEKCGIIKLLETKRNTCELKEFDVIELKQLFTDEEIKQFEELPKNQKFIESLVKLSSIFNANIKGCSREIEMDKEKESIKEKVLVDSTTVVNDFFKNYVSITLNNAEYFSMAFTHNTADETVIYQSIHTSFLEMCFVMYYYISVHSDPAKAKLYTNIADLYCKWRSRQLNQKREYECGQRQGSKQRGTIIVDD